MFSMMGTQSVLIQPEVHPLMSIYQDFYREKLIPVLEYSLSSCSYYSCKFELKTLEEKELLLLMLIHGLSKRDASLSTLAASLAVAVPSPIAHFSSADQVTWLIGSRYCNENWIKAAVKELDLITLTEIMSIPDSMIEAIQNCSMIPEKKDPPKKKDVLMSDILESSIFQELLTKIETVVEGKLRHAIEFSNKNSKYSREYMERMVWSTDVVYWQWQSLFLVLLFYLKEGDISLSCSTIDLLAASLQFGRNIPTVEDTVVWLTYDFVFDPQELTKALRTLQAITHAGIIRIPQNVLDVCKSLSQISSPIDCRVPGSRVICLDESKSSTTNVIEISDDEIEDKSRIFLKQSGKVHKTKFVSLKVLKKTLKEQCKMMEEHEKLIRVALEKVKTVAKNKEHIFAEALDITIDNCFQSPKMTISNDTSGPLPSARRSLEASEETADKDSGTASSTLSSNPQVISRPGTMRKNRVLKGRKKKKVLKNVPCITRQSLNESEVSPTNNTKENARKSARTKTRPEPKKNSEMLNRKKVKNNSMVKFVKKTYVSKQTKEMRTNDINCESSNTLSHDLNTSVINSSNAQPKTSKTKDVKKRVESKRDNLRKRIESKLPMLHYAILGGYKKASLRIIRSLKAEINSVDRNGETALHLAVRQGSLELVCELVDVGKANVNALSNSQRSALHVAALAGSLPIIKYLLSKGANVSQRDADGMAPMDLLRKKNTLASSLLKPNS